MAEAKNFFSKSHAKWVFKQNDDLTSMFLCLNFMNVIFFWLYYFPEQCVVNCDICENGVVNELKIRKMKKKNGVYFFCMSLKSRGMVRAPTLEFKGTHLT